MINKEKAAPLVREIADRATALRALLREGTGLPSREDQTFAHDIIMIEKAIEGLAEKCGIVL
jgi:hypothetical protein